MAQSGNKGRTNTSGQYRDRASMKGDKEVLGEDISNLGKGKGSDRKRLANEIDDNVYDDNVEVIISDDPRGWGGDLQANFVDFVEEGHKETLAKYVRIIKKAYGWLQDSEQGKEITSLVELRSYLGIVYRSWVTAEDNSEEFSYYSTLIRELISARVHYLGMTNPTGQIFKIFSLKKQLPDEFGDENGIPVIGRVDAINIIAGDKDSVKKAIEEGTKRLKK